MIGMGLSMFGMLDRFAEFLNVLGIAFAGVLGVILTEYYFLKAKGKSNKPQKIDLVGVASWLIGALVVYASSEVYEVGIACLNGLVISGIFYGMIKKFLK